MVDTIGPMVRGTPDRRRGIQQAHLVGGALGGLLTGVLVSLSGRLILQVTGVNSGQRPRLALLAAAVAAAFFFDLNNPGRSIGLHRQTPRAWRYLLPPALTAFLNGFDLGLGWTTRVYYASYVAVVAAMFVTGNVIVGGALGLLFGLSRAGTVVIVVTMAGTRRIDAAAKLVAVRARTKAVNLLALASYTALCGWFALETWTARAI